MAREDVGQLAREYVAAGLVLVAFDRGRKGPTHRGWNLYQACIVDGDEAETITGNLGLAHAYSRTCALDLDDLDAARAWLAARGVDVDELLDAPDAVGITSGRPNRAKLLYRLPIGVEPLWSKKPTDSGLELRCATGAGLTVQDVLPPSIHPDTGRAYEWRLGPVGDWAALPELPAALLQVWQGLLRPAQDDGAPRSPLGLEAERLRGVLARIDPDLEYGDWARVGAALHHESGGAEWGLDLWDEWSQGGGKYKGRGDLLPHWRSWGRYKGRPVTAQWLLGQAGGCSPDDFDDLNAIPEPPPKRPRFEVLPVFAFASGAPPEWIVKGVLARAGLGILYGESGAGKSFLVLDLILAIARGEPWNGRRVRQGRVVYICAEGQAGLRNRVRAWSMHTGVDLVELPIGVITDVPSLLTQDHVVLAERVNAWGGADVIVIDTLAQTTPGSNENSSEDMGKALAHCRVLHAATGAMVVLVHHAGKDAARGARGWSGIKAAADTELEVTRDGDARLVRVSKQKDGEDGLAFSFRLRQVDLGVDGDGDPVTSCVVEYVEAPASREHARTPRTVTQRIVWEAALDCVDLCEGDIPIDTLLTTAVQRVPLDPEARDDNRRRELARALNGLVADGWLTHTEGVVRFKKG